MMVETEMGKSNLLEFYCFGFLFRLGKVFTKVPVMMMMVVMVTLENCGRPKRETRRSLVR